MFRSGNPSLRKDTFKKSTPSFYKEKMSAVSTNKAPSSGDFIDVSDSSASNSSAKSNVMTINGTVNKISILLGITILTAAFSWMQTAAGASPIGFMLGGAAGGLIVALIIIFKQHLAPALAWLYAAFQGLMLGAISMLYELMAQANPNMPSGIAFQACLLTFAILGALLFAYKTKIIKVTENFKLGVAAATGGIFIFYMVSMVIGFFGVAVPVLNPLNGSLFSIGFSVVVVVIAALNLVMDFDFIEEGVKMEAPKYMEWYGAFGLLMTLVWLYLEILRLLSKLYNRN